MNKILHVALREFLATVATKGFIFGLVIMPLLVLVMIFGMRYLFTNEAPRIEGDVAVVDPTGEVLPGIRSWLEPEKIAERRDEFQKLIDEKTPEAVRQLQGAGPAAEARKQALEAMQGQIPDLKVVEVPVGADLEQEKAPLRTGKPNDPGRLVLVVVAPDAVQKSPGKQEFGKYELFMRDKLDDRLIDEIKEGVKDAIVSARVRQAGLDRKQIEELSKVGRVVPRTVTAEGEKDTNEILNAMLPGAFMLLLFMSVMTGGQSLMTTTVEEKASRVVEVLLAAVSPMQLMAGKIIGQMAVGFIVLAVYASMGLATLVAFAMLGMVDLSLLFYLVVFYMIAYFVVASLLGAVGAAVNEMREAQSLMGPVMLILVIPWMLWMPISRSPDSTFAVIMSFLPPINPFVMLIRMTSSSPPPMWQVWLSILIGAASVYGALWFAAKVFRVGVLMYGKPPNLATLVKWARMA